MKNTILFFALFLSYAALAQFPRTKPELLIGHEVKIKPLNEAQAIVHKGYTDFYTDLALQEVYEPTSKGIWSNTAALEGKTFKVTNVEPFTYPGLSKQFYKITLENNGKAIYHKYAKHDVGYLEPLNFKVPEGYYCDYVEKETDSSGDVYYSIDIITIKDFWITKTIYKSTKAVEYSVAIRRFEGKTNAAVGTIVLEFENGKSLSFPENILDKDLINFEIKEPQLKILKENTIKSVKADMLTKNFTESGELFRGVINCIPAGNK